jgi:hypothetical protein
MQPLGVLDQSVARQMKLAYFMPKFRKLEFLAAA